MALSPDEIAAIQADLHGEKKDEEPSTFSKGLKVALVAGSVLGAGFLLWRWREGSRADDQAKTIAELEAVRAPQLSTGAAPSAHCSCGSHEPLSLDDPRLIPLAEAIRARGLDQVRGDSPELRAEIIRRLRP